MALYKELADRIVDDIEAMRLTQSTRMPSIRQFSSLQKVSITTALNCYQRLESLGWLIAKPQSGYYVSRPIKATPAPSYPKFQAKIVKPVAQPDIETYKLSPFYISLLAPALVPQHKLNRAIKHTVDHIGNAYHRYPNYQGEQTLRDSLARHFNQQYFPMASQDLVITNGCIDALKTAIEVTTDIGDVVAICSPCFNGIIELLANMGRNVVEIPFFDEKIDMEQLEHQFKHKTVQAFLLSANNINPQGCSLSTTQKKHIAKLANQYQLPVIEDDIYLELSYQQQTPLPIKYWDNNGWVLWCGSLSKSLSPSIRIGWCHAGRFAQQYNKHHAVTSFGNNSMMQHAMANFIDSGQYLKHLKKVRLQLANQAKQYHQLLSLHLPKSARISTPRGGLVIWIQVPNLDSELLLIEAGKQSIYFRAGRQFTTLDLYQDCFRINLGWPLSAEPSDSDEHSHYQQLILLAKLVHRQLATKKDS